MEIWLRNIRPLYLTSLQKPPAELLDSLSLPANHLKCNVHTQKEFRNILMSSQPSTLDVPLLTLSYNTFSKVLAFIIVLLILNSYCCSDLNLAFNTLHISLSYVQASYSPLLTHPPLRIVTIH